MGVIEEDLSARAAVDQSATASHTDRGNVVTTECAHAAALYTKGVALLIHSSPDTEDKLRAAVEADSNLAVAFAALALDAHTHGRQADAKRTMALSLARMHGATRRERQHIEIVGLVVSGQHDRARALAAAHLEEFPLDSLIAHLVEPSDRP